MEKYMIIDGMRIPFTDEKNILQVIHKAGIHVPTFCYYSDMSIFGACRMCVERTTEAVSMLPVPPLPRIRWRLRPTPLVFTSTER